MYLWLAYMQKSSLNICIYLQLLLPPISIIFPPKHIGEKHFLTVLSLRATQSHTLILNEEIKCVLCNFSFLLYDLVSLMMVYLQCYLAFIFISFRIFTMGVLDRWLDFLYQSCMAANEGMGREPNLPAFILCHIKIWKRNSNILIVNGFL